MYSLSDFGLLLPLFQSARQVLGIPVAFDTAYGVRFLSSSSSLNFSYSINLFTPFCNPFLNSDICAIMHSRRHTSVCNICPRKAVILYGEILRSTFSFSCAFAAMPPECNKVERPHRSCYCEAVKGRFAIPCDYISMEFFVYRKCD